MRRALLVGLLPLLGCAPKDPQPFIDSAKVKTAATNFNGAIADYTTALRADPRNVEALIGRASVKFRLGELNAALFDWNVVLQQQPQHTNALLGRAVTFASLGQLTNANADFAALAKLDSTNATKAKFSIAQGLLQRARGNSARGDNERAVKGYDAVIGLFPDVGVAYHERGAAKLDLNRYAEAIADFDLAIKHDAWHNQFGDTFVLRAKAKRALGDTNGAAADERESEKLTSRQKP